MMGIRVMQKLLNYLNGEIGVWLSIESTENVGTTITISLKF